MTGSPIVALPVDAAGLDAVRDALLEHGDALVFDPADKVSAFVVRVAHRALVVVDADGISLGMFGSVRSAVRRGAAGRNSRSIRM